MAHVAVIASGKSKRLPEVAAAAATARASGLDIDVALTLGGGHAARLVELAVAGGALRVVAAGGDGTVQEVGEALAGTGVPMGVLPCGTANDFARGLGIPHDLDEAIAIAICTAPRPCDVGSLNGQTFVNMATFGFAAELSSDTDPAIKKAIGPLAYGAHAVSRAGELAPFAVELSAAGGWSWGGEALLVSIGNGRQSGDGKVLHPTALVDDGLLDVLIVPAVGAPTFVGMLLSAVVSGDLGHQQSLVRARLPALQVRAASTVRVTCDGEPTEGELFEVLARPGVLELVAPADSTMLSAGAV